MTAPSRPLLAALALLASLALTGCQTYTSQTADRDSALRSGNIAAAVAAAERDATRAAGSKNSILYRLEQGAILRAAALANLPDPATALATASSTPAPALTAGQTQTNEALLAAAPEDVSSRIHHLTRSLAAFDEAAREIDEYEAAARVSVGAETGALLTNQANVPYRGRAYDKVMLHTYQALNYLQLADPDAARVELNRALQRQRDAVELNAKRIEEAQEIAAEARADGVTDDQGRAGDAYDVERATSDPATASGIANIESRLDAAILPYGDYVNPFTTLLDALVFTHQGTDASDLERARKSWERVVNFAPSNPYAQADYIAVEPDLQPAPGTAEPQVHPDESGLGTSVPTETTAPDTTSPVVESAVIASTDTPETAAPAVPADAEVPPAPASTPPVATAPESLTYVIFETGSAPYRDQVRIDIPLFLATGGISYVGAAFPTIATVEGHATHLDITTTDGASYPTALVASMDSVVAQDFKNEWPSILTKTLISTATKATIDAVLQKQIQDQAGPTGALLFQFATAITQAAINIADTRTWRSLPKEFHYARLPTPADRRLTLTASGLSTTVTVEPAAVNVVYVKSPGAFSPLFASQFILKN